MVSLYQIPHHEFSHNERHEPGNGPVPTEEGSVPENVQAQDLACSNRRYQTAVLVRGGVERLSRRRESRACVG